MTYAVPAVLAAMAVSTRRTLLVAAVISAGVALWLQTPRLVRVYDPEFVAGLRELRAERGPVTLLVGSYSADMEALTIGAEDQLFVDSDKIKAWVDFESPKAGGKSLPQWFDEQVALFRAIGQPLLVCASARERMQLYQHDAINSLWRDHVEVVYDVEAIDRRGLHGWLLKPRAR